MLWFDDLHKATAEELAESLKTPRAGTRKEKNVSSASAPPSTRPVATPARSSNPENQGESGNPAQQKRLRAKTPDPDKAQKIESLRQVGTSMGGCRSTYRLVAIYIVAIIGYNQLNMHILSLINGDFTYKTISLDINHKHFHSYLIVSALGRPVQSCNRNLMH